MKIFIKGNKYSVAILFFMSIALKQFIFPQYKQKYHA